MQPDFLKHNLAFLETKDPALAGRLGSVRPTGKYSVRPSKSGPAAASRVMPGGSTKALHSAYDPLREASRFLDSIVLGESINFIFFGFGLGYHALEIVKRVPKQSRMVFIERDAELFRLALTCNDCAPVLSHPGAAFCVGLDPGAVVAALGEDLLALALNGYVPVVFKPLADLDGEYYHSIGQALEKALQRNRVDFKTQSAFSRLFYNNIIDNLPNILASAGVNQLKSCFEGLPAIVVSAGPSLDKNIHLLKGSQDNAVLISVATAFRPLLKNEIEPDFVVAIDPDESMINAFDLEKFPAKTWLLYDPGVHRAIPENFRGKRIAFDSRIYLSQWIAERGGEKGSLGKTQSVAHTALQFALHLGCEPVVLAGQDLAFSKNRMHCSKSYFYEDFQDAIAPAQTLGVLDIQKCQKYARSMTTVPDLFGNPVLTTSAMVSYKNLFADEFDGGGRIFNATEGGIPISGIHNLCLREALNAHCRKTIAGQKTSFASKAAVSPPPSRLISALKAQALRFARLLGDLTDLKRRYLPGESGVGNRRGFVSEMETLYKNLLGDADTLQLLQGHSYSGFLRWNRKNSEIERKTQTATESGILEEKFKRDSEFMDVLAESASRLRQEFDDMAEKLGPA